MQAKWLIDTEKQSRLEIFFKNRDKGGKNCKITKEGMEVQRQEEREGKGGREVEIIYKTHELY